MGRLAHRSPPLAGGSPFDDAMADYQRIRDITSLPMFELTPPEFLAPANVQRIMAVAGSAITEG